MVLSRLKKIEVAALAQRNRRANLPLGPWGDLASRDLPGTQNVNSLMDSCC